MKQITNEEAREILEKAYPRGVELNYVDYRDEIEDKDALEELAQTGRVDSIMEDYDWALDQQCDSIMDVIRENFSEYEITDSVEEYIRDWCYQNDTSEVVQDLVRNTRRGYYYYDLNYYVEEGSPFYVNEVMEKLNIPAKYVGQIKEMVLNAVYGGRLAILFVAEPKDLYGARGHVTGIKFKDPELVVMDRNQGSGWWSGKLEGLTIEVAFHNSNLHFDNGAPGYSFSGEVCGMSPDDTSVWNFTTNKYVYDMGEDEDTKRFAHQEKIYNDTFKAGKCTYGDSKIGRHRNTEYINDFPCGTKCRDCGQFWID